MPYVGHFVKGVDTFNKTYQTGENIARAKAIYDECKKKIANFNISQGELYDITY